ncbi:hypothetical protein ACX6XY_13450 [Streptomyces sp. O3]
MVFSKQVALRGSGRPCARVCGLSVLGSGGGEVVVLRQVLGMCLRLSVRLSGGCPAGKDG